MVSRLATTPWHTKSCWNMGPGQTWPCWKRPFDLYGEIMTLWWWYGVNRYQQVDDLQMISLFPTNKYVYIYIYSIQIVSDCTKWQKKVSTWSPWPQWGKRSKCWPRIFWTLWGERQHAGKKSQLNVWCVYLHPNPRNYSDVGKYIPYIECLGIDVRYTPPKINYWNMFTWFEDSNIID